MSYPLLDKKSWQVYNVKMVEITNNKETEFDFEQFFKWKKEKDDRAFYGATVKVFPKAGFCEVHALGDEDIDDLIKVLLIAIRTNISRSAKYNQTSEGVIYKFCHEFLDGKRKLGKFEDDANLSLKK
jgi:hypothetical protein